MSEEQKKILEQQLWNIANTLRGKMNADEFRDYILGLGHSNISTTLNLYVHPNMEQKKKAIEQMIKALR